MSTPAEIAAGASCFTCIPNKVDALLYLFANISGVTDPAVIAVNARCYSCIPNKEEALLYLADRILSAGGTEVVALTGSNTPSTTPSGAAIAYNENSNLWTWNITAQAWVQLV